MYTNIYKKIKILAWVYAIVGISISIIFALTSIIYGIILGLGDPVGLLFFLLGVFLGPICALLSWVSTWTLYAFGEMLENLFQIKQEICKKTNDNSFDFDSDLQPEKPREFL